MVAGEAGERSQAYERFRTQSWFAAEARQAEPGFLSTRESRRDPFTERDPAIHRDPPRSAYASTMVADLGAEA